MKTFDIACPVHHRLETIPVPFGLKGEVRCGASENPALLHIEVVLKDGEPKIQRLFVVREGALGY